MKSKPATVGATPASIMATSAVPASIAGAGAGGVGAGTFATGAGGAEVGCESCPHATSAEATRSQRIARKIRQVARRYFLPADFCADFGTTLARDHSGRQNPTTAFG